MCPHLNEKRNCRNSDLSAERKNALSRDSLEKNKSHLLLVVVYSPSCCWLFATAVPHSCVCSSLPAWVLPQSVTPKCYPKLCYPKVLLPLSISSCCGSHISCAPPLPLRCFPGRTEGKEICRIFLSSLFFLTSLVSPYISFAMCLDLPAFALPWEWTRAHFPSEC